MVLKKAKYLKIWILTGYCIAWMCACSSPPPASESDYIIKTRSLAVSSEDFIEELDLKQTAYPYDIKKNPDEYNQMVIDLVKILTDEIILLSEAAEKEITVSDDQVRQAEDELRKDYPENSFEQMLLKNAIFYPVWKKRFRKSMIITRLIEEELTQKVEISSRDIIDFYKEQGKLSGNASDPSTGSGAGFQDEKQLVSRLRTQKAQDLYEVWLHGLWEKFPIEIDNEKLKTFLIDIETSKEH